MTTPVFVAGSGVHGEATNTIALNTGTNAGRTVIGVTWMIPTSGEHVTGVTYGGAAMTEAFTGFNSVGGTQFIVQGWYLKNAASGSNNLVISTALGGSSLFVTFAAYDTCDTTAPVTGVVTFDNTVGSAGALSSGAITSAGGNLAVVIGETYASGHLVDTYVDGTGVTNRFNHAGDTSKVGGFVLDKAGASSVTITDTLTCSDAGAVTNCFGMGFNLVGAAGGAGVSYSQLERGIRGINRGLNPGVA